jgi:hypothetical protein
MVCPPGLLIDTVSAHYDLEWAEDNFFPAYDPSSGASVLPSYGLAALWGSCDRA